MPGERPGASPTLEGRRDARTGRGGPAPRGRRVAGRRASDRPHRRRRATRPRPGMRPPVITASELELRAGSRVLLSGVTLRVQPGDRIGLVGRNGAGKTTSLRAMAGESEPYGGTIPPPGPVGYRPQDPREGDLSVLARDRVLSARGLDQLLRDMEKVQTAMAELADDAERDKAVARYGRLEP